MNTKIVDLEELGKIVGELKEQGKKIVATSGCFDILHAGHVAYLNEAKKLGDILVVFVNSDYSVRQLKGDERPIVSQAERAYVLSGLESVDYICFFNELTPCNVLRNIKPEIFAKGGDYQGKDIPEMNVLETYGGQIQYLNIVYQCSSTNIIEKIKELVKK